MVTYCKTFHMKHQPTLAYKNTFAVSMLTVIGLFPDEARKPILTIKAVLWNNQFLAH